MGVLVSDSRDFWFWRDGGGWKIPRATPGFGVETRRCSYVFEVVGEEEEYGREMMRRGRGMGLN